MEEKRTMKKQKIIIIGACGIMIAIVLLIVMVLAIKGNGSEDLQKGDTSSIEAIDTAETEVKDEEFAETENEELQEEDNEENLETTDEEVPEITDEDRKELQKYYSNDALDMYEFDEKGNIIREDDEKEKEIMTQEEYVEEFKDALRKIQEQSTDIPILGTWTRLDSEGQISEGNYIKFNSDGTYERGGKDESNEVIIKGQYLYAPGALRASTREIEKVSKGFKWYDVILSPTYMSDNGKEITEEGNKQEYIFGISVNNENQMVIATSPRSAFIKTAK